MPTKENDTLNILSLFDGISCGMLAAERANIFVDRYVAYEIEPNAIKISNHHFPFIERKGNVYDGNFKKYKDFDLVIGGSPCTFWSVARTNKGREITSDGEGFRLFLQFVRALNESDADYFIYENNYSIHKDIKAEISRFLQVEPILINSSLVSAQNRKRLYWTNIEGIQQPKDQGILLEDIITSGVVDRKKSLCIARRTVGNRGSQDYLRRRYFGKSFAQMVFEGCEPSEQKALFKKDPYGEFEGEGFIRPLNILEMERLQTLPDNYTAIPGISENDRGEAIGNGWTVDVIAHIMTHIQKAKDVEYQMNLWQETRQLEGDHTHDAFF
jgi:site-specific DNA-cytosine methylase